MTARVVLATDRNENYSFFAPISALLWRRLGFEPTVIAVGAPSAWQTLAIVHVALRTRDVDVVYTPEVEGFATATVAQVSRLFAPACLGFDDDDVVYLSDVDYWPLFAPWFRQATENGEKLALFFANACLPRYTINGVSAPVRVWRDLIGGGGARSLDVAVEHCLRARAGETDRWGLDETLLTEAIGAYAGAVVKLERRGWPQGWPDDRIDRAAWPVTPERVRRRLANGQPVRGPDGVFTDEQRTTPRPVVDAHLLRPGYSEENWPLLRPILEAAAPEHLPWIDEYRERFRSAAQ